MYRLGHGSGIQLGGQVTGVSRVQFRSAWTEMSGHTLSLRRFQISFLGVFCRGDVIGGPAINRISRRGSSSILPGPEEEPQARGPSRNACNGCTDGSPDYSALLRLTGVLWISGRRGQRGC